MTTVMTNSAALRRSLLPLVLDVAVPVGSYYVFRDGLGMSAVAALGWSSAVPAVRTGWSVVRGRTVNAMAALILAVNVVGVLLSFVAGDARLMLLKDSGVSSVVGIGVLVSVRLGRPMMTEGMKPFLIRGDAERDAAWQRLAAGSMPFRRAERTFSVVWGVALLGECVARIVGVYVLPVDTMVWLGTLVMVGAMLGAVLVGGALAVDPMKGMLRDEVARYRDRGSDAGVAGIGADFGTRCDVVITQRA
ncbi:VC0807 family protein [Streptomyces sp. NBC_00459]|uniref:VC0807 family protein n=1 Tax=Streptomyces sp. NBC_00459 TaxID=2975749 RepID=UPI002E170382